MDIVMGMIMDTAIMSIVIKMNITMSIRKRILRKGPNRSKKIRSRKKGMILRSNRKRVRQLLHIGIQVKSKKKKNMTTNTNTTNMITIMTMNTNTITNMITSTIMTMNTVTIMTITMTMKKMYQAKRYS